MVKVTCDRCGRQCGTSLPWTTLEFPILTITSQASKEEKPWMIDLCQVCKIKFYDWLDDGKIEQESIVEESKINLPEEQK